MLRRHMHLHARFVVSRIIAKLATDNLQKAEFNQNNPTELEDRYLTLFTIFASHKVKDGAVRFQCGSHAIAFLL